MKSSTASKTTTTTTMETDGVQTRSMKIHAFVKPLAQIEVVRYSKDYWISPYSKRDEYALKFAASDQPNNLKEVEMFFDRFNEWTSRAVFKKLKARAATLAARWDTLNSEDDKTFEVFKVLAREHFDGMSIHDMDHYTMSQVVESCSTREEVDALVKEYNETYFRELIQSLQEDAETITTRLAKHGYTYWSYYYLLSKY